MIYKETTREDVIAQARASSDKLGCDPDLLELMAIRIWEAAIETSTTKVCRMLHQWEGKRPEIELQYRIIMSRTRADSDLGAALIHLTNAFVKIVPDYLNSAIKNIQEAK